MKIDTVAVVVDSEFGDDLETLAKNMPVWIVASPANIAAATPMTAGDGNITTFQVMDLDNREQNLLDILDTVDLHHGPFSSSVPYRSVLVVRLERSSSVIAALTAMGFGNAREDAHGFLIELIGPYLNRD